MPYPLTLISHACCRLALLNAPSEDVAPTIEEVEDTAMEGRHEENSIQDIMKELEIVTNLGAKLQMFEKSKHVKPQDVVDPFEEQARLEREEEERRILHEEMFQNLLETAMAKTEESLVEESYQSAFAKGYRELPQLLPVGYRRLKPPSPSSAKKNKQVKQVYGHKKIEKDGPSPENSLVLFDRQHDPPVSSLSKSLPLPLPRVNQADLQCRHDSELNYQITYQIKTGKRFTDKQKDEDYSLTFSNITNQPNPNPPKKKISRFGSYELADSRPASSNDLVVFDANSSGNVKSIEDSFEANSVKALDREAERKREKDKELSLSQLGSVYIEKQHQTRRLKEPDWMLMQHRLRLNESIHTQKFVTFEIVSMAKTVELRDKEFIMNKPIVRFGTLEACDYTIKCSNNAGGDIRKERSLSKIHCMVYVPLVSPRSTADQDNMKKKRTNHSTGGKKKKYVRSYDSDSDDGDSDSDSDEEAERRSHEKRASQVTIVDNHSCWGTYVVTQRGVRKVPTTIQAGIPLEHGDLICMGITRNGPPAMTPIEANRALLVFRVRTDYCVTIGKVPEFNVGEMIMSEQEKSERVEKAAYK
jgi:hypothetical protein